MAFCTSCGAALKPGAKFCSACGTGLGQAMPTPVLSAGASRRGRSSLTLAAAALGIAAVGTAGWLLYPSVASPRGSLVASSSAAETSDSPSVTSVLVSLPRGADDGNRPDLWNDLALRFTGELALNGKPVAPEDLATRVRADIPNGKVGTRLAPEADSRFGDVVSTIMALQEIAGAKFGFLGNERYRSFENHAGVFVSDTTREAILRRPDFVVAVASDGVNSPCKVDALGPQDVPLAASSEQLFDLAFAHLDRRVQLAGGVDAFDLAGAVVTIRADARTPWRCVAGVVYNVQAAGNLGVRMEIRSIISD